MNPEHIADLLIAHYHQPDFQLVVADVREQLTLEVVGVLKQRVDKEKFSNAHTALQIAEVAEIVATYLPESSEATPLALWTRGNALFHHCLYQEALECYRRAAVRYRQQNQIQNVAILLINQVAVLQGLGDFPAALELDQQARAMCAMLGEEAREYLAALDMNIGSVYQQMGDLSAALAAYARGRAISAALYHNVEVAHFDINRANVLEEMDRFTDAEALLTTARRDLEQAGQHQEVARVDLNLGVLAYRRGAYQMALSYLESAHQGFATIPIPGEVAVVSLYRSFVYRDLNLFQEMITLAAEAAQTFEQETTRWQQAMALITQGIGYQRLGIHTMAERLFKRARYILRQQKAHARVLMLDVDRASLLLELGQVDIAERLARLVERYLEQHPSPTLTARLHILLARCALSRTPSHQEVARQRTAAALEIARLHHLRDVTVDAYYLSGQILEQDGDVLAALEHYRTAIQTIEQVRSELPLDEFQMSFMDNKLCIYEAAVRLSQTLESPTEVFYTLNLAHRAPFVYLASASGSDLPPDSDIMPRLRELRETWHWYQTKLEGVDHFETEALTTRQDAANEHKMRQQLYELETAIADLTHRWRVGNVAQKGGTTMALSVPAPLFTPIHAQAFLKTLQERLHACELLLHYTVIDGKFHAMVVTHSSIHMLPVITSVAPLQRVLRAWRFQMEHSHLQSNAFETGRSVPAAHLSRFYSSLIAPLEPYLAGYEHIFLVIPPGWHDLPFAAFFDGQTYLIERFRLTYLSAPEVLLNRSSLRFMAPPIPEAKPTALLIGYSDDGRLPYALEEVRQVAAALQRYMQTMVVVEDEATTDCLRRTSEKIRLLHLSTHAAFRQDNPLFSWMRLVDRRLTVADLCEMTLPQRPLVVLSACETGRGQPRGGGLLGMGRGFLAAGASGLIVGLWKVADRASAEFMTDFYTTPEPANLLNDPSAALHQAQLRALARHNPPFVWAGFIFIQG